MCLDLQVVSSQFTSVLILEDDPYFYPQFREKFSRLLEDVRNKEIDWELMSVVEVNVSS